MAGVVPRRRREVVENSSAEYFVEGNPNRQVAGAKGTPGYGKIQHSPGVPRVEYTKIEICKADLVRDERINRANRRLIKYYNEIRSSRIQILETEFERKVKVKGEAKPRGRKKSPESRPNKPEVAHLKATLKVLLARMDEMLAAVRRVGGVPISPPPHFSKELPV